VCYFIFYFLFLIFLCFILFRCSNLFRLLLIFTLLLLYMTFRCRLTIDYDCVDRIYQADEKTCKICHEECDSSCIGPNADQCIKCKHVQDGPFCVPICPSSKYNDSGQCKPCHENCINGCDGPENNINANGCHSCEKEIMDDKKPEKCLHKKEPCPEGKSYFNFVS